MPSRLASLVVLIATGAVVAAALARRLERVDSGRLARGYLVAVTALMGVRVGAWVAANVFGVNALRPAGTGPHDLTNLLVGALLGLAAVHAARGGLDCFWRAPELLLALRLTTGVAFVPPAWAASSSGMRRPALGQLVPDVNYAHPSNT